jgi:pimeloyl-ACP methyl ester carboxylesterase
MPRRAPVPLLSALLALLVLAVSPSSANAARLGYKPCAEAPAFSCAALAVPLVRGGAVPGTISLGVERRLAAGSTPSRDAVVALAGGPGQAALPLGEFIAQAIAPALSTRDLLVFDQRGTGSSDPLHCLALERFSSEPVGKLFEHCALQLGAARAGFTTQESVQDIEALRVAGGYEKLVLYGTSYGTKVALEYAERYPQNVEALLLDSVVPSDGPEPFAIPTFQAIGGALQELCADHACTGITPNPLGDVAQLAAELHRRPLSGSVFDGAGRRHASELDEVDLLHILQAGDLNPALRALLPAAVRSALRRDPDPLLRLNLLSEGLIPNVPDEGTSSEGSGDIDEVLFYATSCEESPFPWQRAASASTRHGEALAFLRAQPAASLYPFDATTAFNNSLAPLCASWPDASATPPPASPLPNVPTLILSGAQDLRTPTANARAVAALIPDAQLEVVPFTGHSVVGSDLSGCAATALKAFFGGSPVQPCAHATNMFAPTPLTPTKLAYVRPPIGLGGRSGQTLIAVLDTLVDFNRQVIGATLQAEEELPSGSSFGGLRGGYARLTSTHATLHDFTFVPGVQISGSFPIHHGHLQTATVQVSGSAAAPGSVRVGSSLSQVTGTLSGRHFDISVARGTLASIHPGPWPALGQVLAALSREHAHARRGELRSPPLP